MGRKPLRPGVALALVLIAVAIGCTGPSSAPRYTAVNRLRGERTAEELRASVGWLGVEAQEAGRGTLRSEDFLAFAERSRAAVKPPVPFPRRSVLVLSGGGSY